MSAPAAVGRPRLADFVPGGRDADAIMSAFLDGVAAQGFTLYPAQEQAVLELMAGKHVILSTPTGSGKSLVATALQFKALAEGKRAWYTCPIKALVSEKFFAACHELGAENVGMITGDARINADAPIICCTAEILANHALREGADAPVDYVVMDEFHYYSDRDRGVAWQIPLLTLPRATFLLMSATLGDTTHIEEGLVRLTGREAAAITGVERPVPLEYEYRESPLHETLKDLVERARAPVYLVSFSQRDAAEQAQNLLSVDFCSKEEKARIGEALAGFRFDTPYGKEMQRFVRHGVGLHHAGLLPKYRLLVEQLSQRGLLKVVSGTDTLGVGVNVPIRTVLFTQLFKFDGERSGILSVRDFKQVAGRAGRKGFDTQGWVAAQAPEHVIENKRIEARAQKGKKAVKKKPPDRFVMWDERTFRELIERRPEPLESRFVVTHAMMLTLLQEPRAGYRRLIELVAASHERPGMKSRHRRHAAVLFRSLKRAGIVSVIRNRLHGARIVVNEELQRDFSIMHTLSLYLLETLPLLEKTSPSYALDVVTLVESILEHPRPVLMKQVDRAKTEKLAELKAQGVEYEQRMEELDKIEHPKPNAELIYETFNAFAKKHPWVGSENIRPKSVGREIYERATTFHEYVRDYGLERSEGVLLRYLSELYRTLVQTVPASFKTDEVLEAIVYLRGMLQRVDDSLVREWEEMVAPAEPQDAAPAPVVRRLFDPKRDAKGFAARVRAELHQLLRALSEESYERALEILRPEEAWTVEALRAALQPFLAEHGRVTFNHDARLPHRTRLVEESPRRYRVEQVLVDGRGDDDWVLEGVIELEALDAGGPLVALTRIGQ